MCLALEEMRTDSKIEGAIKTCKKFNMPLQETIRFISEEYNLSLQQAEKEVKKYWQ